MTYLSRGLLSSIGVVIWLVPILSFGQTAFDVKTSFQEKSQLRIIKAGVLASLESSSWASVKELGEDYSLWLAGFLRTSVGDSLRTEIEMELRTPALINRGKLLNSRHVSVVFDTSGISAATSSTDTLMNAIVAQGIQSLGLLDDVTKFFPSGILFGNLWIYPFIARVLEEFGRQPSPLERLEATLVAARVMIALDEMLREH